MDCRGEIRSRKAIVLMGVMGALWISPCVGRDIRLERSLKDAVFSYMKTQGFPFGNTEEITVKSKKDVDLSFLSSLKKISFKVAKSDKDSLELLYSSRLSNHPNLALVNAANANHPGGGFLGDGFVQEESLCAVANLFPSLKQQFYALGSKILKTTGVKRIIDTTKLAIASAGELFSDRVLSAFSTVGKSVFLSVSQIKAGQPFTVFSMAAPNRSNIDNFDQKRFFNRMFNQYTKLFKKFNKQCQGVVGHLILTLPGSGVFARKKDGSYDHDYLTLNTCAAAAALLKVSPRFETTIPKSMCQGRDLAEEILGYVQDPQSLKTKLDSILASSAAVAAGKSSPTSASSAAGKSAPTSASSAAGKSAPTSASSAANKQANTMIDPKTGKSIPTLKLKF